MADAENIESVREKNLIKWKPGQSGNPGGRPASERVIVQLIRRNAPRLIETLLEISADPRHPSCVPAIKELLARGYGKPVETIKFDGRIEAVSHVKRIEHIRPMVDVSATSFPAPPAPARLEQPNDDRLP
jgi:hypothetical protein